MRIKEKLIGLRLIYVTVCHRKTFVGLSTLELLQVHLFHSQPCVSCDLSLRAGHRKKGSKIAKELPKFSRPEKTSFWQKTVNEYVASEAWRLSPRSVGDLKKVISAFKCGDYFFFYSKSFLLGFREGSFDRKPKVKREIKKITTV